MNLDPPSPIGPSPFDVLASDCTGRTLIGWLVGRGEAGSSNAGPFVSLIVCDELGGAKSDRTERPSCRLDDLLLEDLNESLFRKASLLLSMKLLKALFSIREASMVDGGGRPSLLDQDEMEAPLRALLERGLCREEDLVPNVEALS